MSKFGNELKLILYIGEIYLFFERFYFQGMKLKIS